MQDSELEKLKFPIGRNSKIHVYGSEAVARCIKEIEELPAALVERVSALTDNQLNKLYRPGGWSARQVIHHLSDSHMNAYIRFKWAQTEERPLIKAYYEDRWAELPDSREGNIVPSLRLLEAVHAKWVAVLKGMDETAFRKSFIHPDGNREIFLFDSVNTYSWHGRHHLAHIELALAS